MAKTTKGRYRIEGYDGDYKTRDLIVSHSEGHRIMRRVSKKQEALEVARKWMQEHPPQTRWQRDRYLPYVLVTDEKTADRLASWSAKRDTGWVQAYDYISRGKNPDADLPPTGAMEGAFKPGQKVKLHPEARAMLAALGHRDPDRVFTILEIVPRWMNQQADAEAAVLEDSSKVKLTIETDFLLPATAPNPAIPVGSMVWVNVGKQGYARVVGHPEPGTLQVQYLSNGKVKAVRTAAVSVIA